MPPSTTKSTTGPTTRIVTACMTAMNDELLLGLRLDDNGRVSMPIAGFWRVVDLVTPAERAAPTAKPAAKPATARPATTAAKSKGKGKGKAKAKAKKAKAPEDELGEESTSQRLLRDLRAATDWTPAALLAVGVDPELKRVELRQLVKKGQVERRGENRKTQYRFK